MSGNPWFRMYAEFASDAKVQMMSEALQRRYMMLMCLRCSGELVTLHETLPETERDAAIAFQLRISEADLAETKRVFMAKGFIDEGWSLLNWDKRQFTSDSSTARVAKHRAKKKRAAKEACNVTSAVTETKSNALDTDTDTEEEQNLTTFGFACAGATAKPATQPASNVTPMPPTPMARRQTFESLAKGEITTAYREILGAAGALPISHWTATRLIKAEAWWSQFGMTPDGWREYLTCIRDNCGWMLRTHRGRDGTGRQPVNIDFVMTEQCYVNVAEGRYDEVAG